MIDFENAKLEKKIPVQLEVDISQIYRNPQNYRSHPRTQVERIAASYERFGQRKPLVVQMREDKLTLVAGEGGLDALELLAKKDLAKWGTAWVSLVPEDWSDDQIRGYLVADNETQRGAEDSTQQLLELLESQKSQGFSLESLGFNKTMYEELLGSLEMEEGRVVDTTKGMLLDVLKITIGEPRHMVSPGDIFRIQYGDRVHYIVCANPFRDWAAWLKMALDVSQPDMLLLTFAGPLSMMANIEREHMLFCVQPDSYIVGHMLDRYAEVHEGASIDLYKHVEGVLEEASDSDVE